MPLTRDQFYNKAIRPNLAVFSSEVKATEIIVYLPCLTITDKEEIEAKRERSGNFSAMQTLLDNLRRRENWPDEFISALRSCEKFELADKMSVIYDKIRGITNVPTPAPTPAPAPVPAPSVTSAGATATVTTATVHNIPPTTPLLLSKPAGHVSAHSTAPSNSESPVLQVPEIPQVQQEPSPKPFSQTEIPPLVGAPPKAPLPAVVSASEMPLPVQQEVSGHTRAAENKTPVLNTLDGLVLTDHTTTSSSVGETLPSTSSQAPGSNTSQVQITKPSTTTPQFSQRLEKIQMPVAVKDVAYSEKLSVQDTNPTLRRERTFQEPEENSGQTANELVQTNNTVGLPVFNGHTNVTRTAQATSSAPTEVENSVGQESIREECFSKPGILQHPEPQQNRAGTLPIFQEEPCSVVSDDLEISRAESSTEPRQSGSPAEQTSSPIASRNLASTSNQPEEDHYESVCESQTLVNVIQFAEDPPAENLNGQPPSMLQRSRVISEEQPTRNHVGRENVVILQKPLVHVADVSDHMKSTTINAREQESNAAADLQPVQREEGRPELFRMSNFHLIAGAGIALSAIFLAWRFKH